jgi:hypothetical protein
MSKDANLTGRDGIGNVPRRNSESGRSRADSSRRKKGKELIDAREILEGEGRPGHTRWEEEDECSGGRREGRKDDGRLFFLLLQVKALQSQNCRRHTMRGVWKKASENKCPTLEEGQPQEGGGGWEREEETMCGGEVVEDCGIRDC